MELTKEFELIYQPNRRNLMVIPAAVVGVLVGLFGLWALFFHGAPSALPVGERLKMGLFWGFVLIAGILTINWMTVTSKQTIRVTEKGIALLNDGKNSVCFYAWTSLPCVAKAKNLRGQRYLVLSPEKLTRQQAITLTNKAALTLKIRFHDRFVIWDNNTEIAKQIFEYVLQKQQSK